MIWEQEAYLEVRSNRGQLWKVIQERKGGQHRGPASTMMHSRRCFQTRNSPKEWDRRSNFILTFNLVSRRFLLLGINFLAPARGPGRISHNTFRKNGLDTEMEILAVGRWLEHPEVLEPKMWAGYWQHLQNLARGVWACLSGLPLPQHPRQNQERGLFQHLALRSKGRRRLKVC